MIKPSVPNVISVIEKEIVWFILVEIMNHPIYGQAVKGIFWEALPEKGTNSIKRLEQHAQMMAQKSARASRREMSALARKHQITNGD